jgi:hypothetical protein
VIGVHFVATSGTASKSAVLLIVVVGVTALVGSTANGGSTPAWKKFELEAQGLSVLMPGTPKLKEIHNRSFIGDIATHEYYVENGRDAYSVEVTDLPGFAVAFSGSDGIYEHAKAALLKTTLSKPVAFTDITLNGVHGKKLVYDTPTKPGHPEMQGEARLFLSGDRLYVADAVVEMKGGKEKMTRFFSSLAIKK